MHSLVLIEQRLLSFDHKVIMSPDNTDENKIRNFEIQNPTETKRFLFAVNRFSSLDKAESKWRLTN